MIRVIIVEDEPPILRSLKILIEKIHPEFKVVETALDGEKAISKLQLAKFDVIFTDIMMPIIDGFGVLSFIEENNMDIIPVILSGYEEFEYAIKAIRYNVLDYLLKPVSIDSLTSILDKTSKVMANKTKTSFMINSQQSTDTDLLSDYNHTSTNQIMVSIERYLESNLAAPITHQSLSTKYGFTPSYLSKLFRKHRGISPSEYLTQLRVEKAKLLMENDSEILTKLVAPMVGFSDPFYFSKIFKKVTGSTPKEYKDLLKNNAKGQV